MCERSVSSIITIKEDELNNDEINQPWRLRTDIHTLLVESESNARHQKYLDIARNRISYSNKISEIPQPTVQLYPELEVSSDDIRIQDYISKADIQNWQLQTIEISLSSESFQNIFYQRCFFPLQLFDNTNFERFSPERRYKFESNDEKVLAEAFLPNIISGNELNKTNKYYVWKNVQVIGYDPLLDQWTVINLENTDGIEYKVNRLHLFFHGENPDNFINRLKYAIELREVAEKMFKFVSIDDCLTVSGLPELEEKLMAKIVKLTSNSVKSFRPEWLDQLKVQANYEYKRILAVMELKVNIFINTEDYSFVKIPIITLEQRDQTESIGAEWFSAIRQDFKQATMFNISGVIAAMYAVSSECYYLERQSLFKLFVRTTFGKAVPLSDFINIQLNVSNTAIVYVTETWTDNVTTQVRTLLSTIGKGWFDLTLSKWEIYLISKISRFMQQVKYRMQKALQTFLETSLTNFCKYLCDPCESVMNIADDYTWDGDFIYSPFDKKKAQIFHIRINMGEHGAYYSTNPNDFFPALYELIRDAVSQCCDIKQIDPSIMENLIFRNDLYLPVYFLIEKVINAEISFLETSYKKIVIPVEAYANKFNYFLAFFRINIESYVDEFLSERRPPNDVKNEILEHKKMKEKYERDLPYSIVIGPFFIDVETLKRFLIVKREDMIKHLLFVFKEKTRSYTEQLIEEYQGIMSKLIKKPTCIENVYETRKLVDMLPDIIEELKANLRLLLQDYRILDYFFYSLSQEEFFQKWEAVGWPHKIRTQIDKIKDNEEQDIAEFRSLHLSTLISFDERVEFLSKESTKYQRIVDPSKALEVSSELKRTWKIVAEMLQQADVLRSRQRLFDMPDIDFSTFDGIVKHFEHYQTLWTSCADILKMKEICYGNSLANIDMDEIRKNVQGLTVGLIDTYEQFNENPEVQDVAGYYLDILEEFKYELIILDYITSAHWSITQWQELIERSKLDFKFSSALNFQYCIKKGILDHFDLVEDIYYRNRKKNLGLEEEEEIVDEVEEGGAEEEKLDTEEPVKEIAEEGDKKDDDDKKEEEDKAEEPEKEPSKAEESTTKKKKGKKKKKGG